MSATEGSSSLTSKTDRTSQDGSDTTIDLDSLADASGTGFSSLFTTNSSKKITKGEIEKKQLLHDIEVLKIELSQKTLMIDTVKADFMGKIEDLEEKLSDAIHQRQLIQARVENQMVLQKEEFMKENRRLKQALQDALKKNKELGIEKGKLSQLNEGLQELCNNVILKAIDEEEYLEMKNKDPNELDPADLITLKIFETRRPLLVQCESLQHRTELLINDLHDKEEELTACKKELDEERLGRQELDIRCQTLLSQIERLKSQLSHKDYKHENFDTMKREKDDLERELLELRRSHASSASDAGSKQRENEQLRKELFASEQRLALLKQDKEYLSKQLFELKPRYANLEDRLDMLMKEVDQAKKAKEEVYEKYLNSRELYKKDYEEKLKNELERISTKTEVELDRIKSNLKELYERENRQLYESRDACFKEKEASIRVEKEMEKKYYDLLAEHRHLQLVSESQTSDLSSDLKIKAHELDRLQMLHQEGEGKVKELSLENEKLQQKVEALMQEFHTMEMKSEKRIAELERREQEALGRLVIFEKMEKELDEAIFQAAEFEDDDTQQLFATSSRYGHMPVTVKRRLQQSVDLARRLLHSKRSNQTLREQLDDATALNKQLQEELSSTKQILNEAQQPYQFLIEGIKLRDDDNRSLKKAVAELETSLSSIDKERSTLKSLNKQLTADLEHLLNQREDMASLRQAVIDIGKPETRRIGQDKASLLFRKIAKGRDQVPGDEALKEGRGARPMLFTKEDPPLWYKKLKASA